MPASPCEAAVRQRGTTAVIDLHGDIDARAAPALDAAYAEASAARPAVVLLNFSAVGYINSTGIALIVGLLARARAQRLRMAAYGLDDHYREIFTITRLADFMTIFPDEDTAVGDPAAV